LTTSLLRGVVVLAAVAAEVVVLAVSVLVQH
jgi:hypothetical protein